MKLKDLLKEKKNIFSDKVINQAQEQVDKGMVGTRRRVRQMGGLGYVDAEQILAHNKAGAKKHKYRYSHVYGVETTRGTSYNVETYICNICGFEIKRRNR